MAERIRDNGGSFGFLTGLLVGGVIGVGLGMLLAPKSGEDLRKEVRDAAERSREAFRAARMPRSGESKQGGGEA